MTPAICTLIMQVYIEASHSMLHVLQEMGRQLAPGFLRSVPYLTNMLLTFAAAMMKKKYAAAVAATSLEQVRCLPAKSAEKGTKISGVLTVLKNLCLVPIAQQHLTLHLKQAHSSACKHTSRWCYTLAAKRSYSQPLRFRSFCQVPLPIIPVLLTAALTSASKSSALIR